MSYFPSTKITSPISSFNELQIAQRTPIIELKSNYGISDLRDNIFENGIELISPRLSTMVTSVEGSYKITTEATSTSRVRLESAERGRYMPGFSAEAGIGIRLGSATSTGIAKWGYFDTTNGFYFKRTSSGLSVNRMRLGVEVESIPRANWDDPLDGTGPSGLTLNDTDGYIYQIVFVHYGYGPIHFIVQIFNNNTNNLQQVIVHTINDPTATSITDPNLPISAELLNNGNATPQTIFVTGRQFSVGGRYEPHFRTTSDFVIAKALTTTFAPVISFRRKEGFKGIRIVPQGYGILASSAVIIQIRVSGQLTGANYVPLNDVSPAETALEKDVSATAISIGEKVYESIHSGGTGNSKVLGTNTVQGIVVPSLFPVTLMARAVSGTSNIDTVFRILEEW